MLPLGMRYKSMQFLNDMKDDNLGPTDPTYTGLDVCLPANAATCIGGAA